MSRMQIYMLTVKFNALGFSCVIKLFAFSFLIFPKLKIVCTQLLECPVRTDFTIEKKNISTATDIWQMSELLLFSSFILQLHL